MILTVKQEEGLKIAVQRYRDNMRYTVISGYAGTGKSTLVNFIIAALNLDPEEVAYIAYTGKAALVLKEKGCPNAMTAHRLLYDSYRKNDGTFYHKPKRVLDEDYALIVLDEASMLPGSMWNLLLSHNIHVIALGDPFQLPPVSNDKIEVLDSPHIFLDEVMRQAKESEIIRVTMDIREKKPLKFFDGKEVKIFPKSQFDISMYYWADQIIAATNNKRREINQIMRQRIFGPDVPINPIEGDRCICLRNDWDNPNSLGDVMVNGTIGEIRNIQMFDNPLLERELRFDFYPDYYSDTDYALTYQDIHFKNINADYNLFKTGNPLVNAQNYSKYKKLDLKQFDFGYCITCWKAQGSEYDKVLLLEESFPRLNSLEHLKYLYTGATRAKEKLVLITLN